MKKLILLFVITGFCSCQTRPKEMVLDEDVPDSIALLIEKEQAAAEKRMEAFGEPISSISFEVTSTDKSVFEDGIIPWASISDPQADLPNLIDKDEVVISDKTVKVVIDYPLNNPYEFILTSEKGFTRAQLLQEISKHYHKVYEEEESTATIKTTPVGEREIQNRNETNGKYGVWGHDITDLDLAAIVVFRTDDDQIVLMLEVES